MSNRNEFLARFSTVDGLIERYHRQLASIRNRTSAEDVRELLVSRTFLCAAVIQLHAPFVATQQASWQKTVCVAIAAGRAVDAVDFSQTRLLDPIIAVSLWQRAVDVCPMWCIADGALLAFC